MPKKNTPAEPVEVAIDQDTLLPAPTDKPDEPAPPLDPDPHRESPLAHKLAPKVVRAIADFGDALTQRQYRAGDIVPWTEERAARYPHLVVVE